jgi:glyceraldehyde 3-phosphate dehydrogenase
MAINVAINGFGRIGRLAFRLLSQDPTFNVVGINDLTDAESLAYLLKYDTAQGRFLEDEVSYEGSNLIVSGKSIPISAIKDPKELPWASLKVDVVLECTGFFVDEEKAGWHLQAGAKKVVISAPAKGNVKTIVFNVNDHILTGEESIISGASCTTNCLAPVVNVLENKFGIVRGFMTTVHALTADQMAVDGPHKAGILSRRGRASAFNIVPSSTGAAKAIGLVLPSLKGKLDGMALRVPTLTGSVVDLTVELGRNTTVAEINEAMKAAQSESFKYTTEPIVSSDVIGATQGSIFDALSTQIVEADGKQLVKVLAWYDNEMSYTAQLVRTVKKFASFIK